MRHYQNETLLELPESSDQKHDHTQCNVTTHSHVFESLVHDNTLSCGNFMVCCNTWLKSQVLSLLAFRQHLTRMDSESLRASLQDWVGVTSTASENGAVAVSKLVELAKQRLMDRAIEFVFAPDERALLFATRATTAHQRFRKPLTSRNNPTNFTQSWPISQASPQAHPLQID